MLNRNILVGASAFVIALGIAGVQAAPKNGTHHTYASTECSKQADTRGLHGKARKKFREACKRKFEHTTASKQK